MRIYLVGGAVRDRLLGRAGGDRDYVVVGARPDELLALGYKPVGRDFPVFLHPDTGAEHALARTERKTAPGYHGFEFHADPAVTLEQDLARRDLTINAMAEDADGRLIDPYGGLRDLEARLLRHVAPAFAEDPVRLLRVARFAARFAPLGFRVADETLVLMQAMVAAGEVDHLVPERVWAEMARALAEPQPSAFLRTLRGCGALAVLLPEVDALYGVPQRPEFHPEIDTGLHIELVLDQAARLAPGDAEVAFAALTHDLGKALTPAADLPRHHGHEHTGLAPLAALCARLKVPHAHAELARLACREHRRVHQALQLRPATVMELLEQSDALRRPGRFAQLLAVCAADQRGRGGHADDAYPQAVWLQRACAAAAAVSAAQVMREGLGGPALGAALRQARVRAIAALARD
ncbi:MAG: multifunctional CCA addition/repair protein [Xanthomonadaceae bacterium]|nr:multifunctional CCA addition/repair protein [Xanthomonadaceae bacterium]